MIEANEVCRVYRRGAERVRALDAVSFEIGRGEFVAIVGPSGSGKSTLLQLIGAMDQPTSGRLRVAGFDLTGLGDGALTRLRRDHVGFVFQHFGLVPSLSVQENIALPSMFSRRRVAGRVEELMERMGLAHRRHHRPGELSGGEMQRVAIARALIHSPELLLADEPTGNLDSASASGILDLFRELNAGGLTLVVVTHNETLASAADRRLWLRDGRLAAEPPPIRH